MQVRNVDMKEDTVAHILLSTADEIEGQTGSVFTVNLRETETTTNVKEEG